MKILYIANIRLPTEKAHGAQIMKMCEAFARLGHEVELVVPSRRNHISDNPFAYYGIKTRFAIRVISVPDTVAYGRFGFLFESLTFGRRAARYAGMANPDIIYGRDEIVLGTVCRRVSTPVVWESHTGAWNFFARRIARSAHRIVVISNGLKEWYTSRGIPAERMAVASDGVDLESFAHPQSKEAARSRLGLPQDAKIALYIGRLDGWKGVNTLFEASKILWPEVLVAVIGGETEQVEQHSRAYPEVRFLGFRPYRELPDNQVAADILVLPTTATDPVGARFTSPLKLFSYMASGIPIVASDVPSAREIIDERSAFLVHSDDPAALARGIQTALSDTTRGERAMRARENVKKYLWLDRADAVLRFI